jgi:hypothetical protein
MYLFCHVLRSGVQAHCLPPRIDHNVLRAILLPTEVNLFIARVYGRYRAE